MFKKNKYLKKDRLSDVIRLIQVLAIYEKYSFRKGGTLEKTLKGKPKSSKDWITLSREHPEFFRVGKNSDGDITSVLLMRFFLERNSIDKGEDLKKPLSIDQTQNLINTASSLHDKELARYQRRSFVIPIWVAILTALVTIFVTLRKEKVDEKKTNKIQQQFDAQNLKIDELSKDLQEIEIQVDTTTKNILQKIK